MDTKLNSISVFLLKQRSIESRLSNEYQAILCKPTSQRAFRFEPRLINVCPNIQYPNQPWPFNQVSWKDISVKVEGHTPALRRPRI